MNMPASVTLFEMGPRDGLQNESQTIALADKLQLLDDLAEAGLGKIETGSFVNPKWIPQMADSDQVFAMLKRRKGVCYSALTPNVRGMQRAIDAAADEVAVFAAASEAFSQKNINCSIEQSLQRFDEVMKMASEHDIPVRGYVSCVLGCPLQGEVDPAVVTDLSARLLDMGCYEISLGDTIGTGTAGSMARLLSVLLAQLPAERFAVHCHDTYGQALANILVALQHGISTIDASVAGLGGCPYAEGATGNVATEDVVYMLEGLQIDCGVNLPQLIAAGERISRVLGRENGSRAAKALG